MSRNDPVRRVGEQGWATWLRSILFEVATKMTLLIGIALAYLLIRAIK